jgi:glycine/D-amino acid oxidase-like deaminating enzyme
MVGGLAGYGAMAACAVGEIAAQWITGDTVSPLGREFDPRRFDDPGYQARTVGTYAGAGAL